MQNNDTGINPAEQITLMRAIKMLKSIKAVEYKIRTPWFSDERWAEEVHRVRKNKGIVDYISTYLNNVQIGDVVTVPVNEVFSDVQAIQASGGAWLGQRIGHGNYSSSGDVKNGLVSFHIIDIGEPASEEE